MKAFINSLERTHWFKALIALITCLLFLIFPSCQKVEIYQDPMLDMDVMSPSALVKKGKPTVGKIKDVDGNLYKTVKIGEQWWMAENLKTTSYSNRDLIGTTDPVYKDISSETTPKYQWAYDGIEGNVATYGRLYTWQTVTDSRKVCPKGWHVPTDAEWTTLSDYLTNNGYGYGGDGDDIAKSMASTTGWDAYLTAGTVGNDQASNNSSGFTALPGGFRFDVGPCRDKGFGGLWWSTTEASLTNAWGRSMTCDLSILGRPYGVKNYGFSVRCLKD